MANVNALELLWKLPDQTASPTTTPIASAFPATTSTTAEDASRTRSILGLASSVNGTRSSQATRVRSAVARMPSLLFVNISSTPQGNTTATTTVIQPDDVQTFDKDGDGDGDGDPPHASSAVLRYVALIAVAVAALLLFLFFLQRRRRKASKMARERRSVTALRRDVDLGRWRVPLMRHNASAAAAAQTQMAQEELPQYEGLAPAYPSSVQRRDSNRSRHATQSADESARTRTNASFVSRTSSRLSQTTRVSDLENDGEGSQAPSLEAVALSGVYHLESDSASSVPTHSQT